MFPMNCQGFHVNASRLHFGTVTKLATILLQHGALNCAHVHEIVLCVTFGASSSRAPFRVLERYLKYIMISTTSRAPVPQTTVCVMFGARRCSVPMRLLDRRGAIRVAKAAERIAHGSGWCPSGPPTSPKDAFWYLFKACAFAWVSVFVDQRVL